MKILIAPNAFKNSLSASQAATAIKCGIEESNVAAECILFPVGDGGDGTGALLGDHFNAEKIIASVKDPLFRDINAQWRHDARGNRAVIEMADASGIRLLSVGEKNPMVATSYGTGQLMAHALSMGCRHVVLCVGGTATVDGGSGLLQALGAVYTMADGEANTPLLPRDIPRIIDADFSQVMARLANCQVDILCDVKNPLLGVNGAVRTFAPQKGASESDLAELEHIIECWSALLTKVTRKDIGDKMHTGAAGGVSAALAATIDATLVNGIEYFLDVSGFESMVQQCDVVITGEGKLDDQTMNGKGPYGVAVLAKRYGKKVIGLAGAVEEPSDHMRNWFDALITITPDGMELSEAIRSTEVNLVRCSRILAMSLAASTT
jgi:glycerate 2-kinase